MVAGVGAFVLAGVLAAVLLGVAVGIDATAAILLAAIVAVGAMAVAIARRFRRGAVTARRCPHCGGFIANSAPYCKHCNEVLTDG